jgi:formylglycine-generating enzyme required for sulfatase activity
MNIDAELQRDLLEHPEDAALWSRFVDRLTEHRDPRGELLRLLHALTQAFVAYRAGQEQRLRDLLAAGVRHPGPLLTNSIGMTLAWVPPGSFLMGSPVTEPERQGDETQHEVTLTRGFRMSVTPVTVTQWEAVLGPSEYDGYVKDKNTPVTQRSWRDANKFAEKLSEMEGKTYRLPTEAEWEYACRAGSTTPFSFGNTLLPEHAAFDAKFLYGGGVRKGGRRPKQVSPVGQYPPNAFGLCDMHGNVREWCADWYNDYPEEPVTDPLQTKAMSYPKARVLRGGNWHEPAGYSRSARRWCDEPDSRAVTNSVRVCCSV